MFKIGDFSRLGQVSVRMLRHYDKLGLLTPNHIDQFTGYRYYTVEQLARLNRIVALNDLGLTLQQIRRLLAKGQDLPIEQLRGMLTLRQAALEQELDEKQLQLARIEARLNQIEQEHKPAPYEVVTKALEPLTVASLRQSVPSLARMDGYCQMLYAQLYTMLDTYDLATLGTELTFYHNDEYVETDLDVETALLIDPAAQRHIPDGMPFTVHTLPAADLAASVVYQGAYRDVSAAILTLLTWIGMQGFVIAGPLRELHLSGPAHVQGQLREPAVIELQVPVQKPA